jgi:hypothetical protein
MDELNLNGPSSVVWAAGGSAEFLRILKEGGTTASQFSLRRDDFDIQTVQRDGLYGSAIELAHWTI